MALADTGLGLLWLAMVLEEAIIGANEALRQEQKGYAIIGANEAMPLLPLEQSPRSHYQTIVF